MYYRDDTGVFDAPLDVVWAFLSRTPEHREAHGHRNNRFEWVDDQHFRAGWEQDLWGGEETLGMRGHVLPPLALAYEIVEGALEGSKFLFYYTPEGPRTRVTLVGQFVSSRIPAGELEEKVRALFDREFAEDEAALRTYLDRTHGPGAASERARDPTTGTPPPPATQH
jgi:hypothetical protein